MPAGGGAVAASGS
uniref:Uncharacterized protein n=1 Tax=Arundo donax TaxID=35708 RepID=A0A0A9H2E6_ARUDO